MSAVAIASLLVGVNLAAPLTPLGAISLLEFSLKVGPKVVAVQQLFDTPEVRAWAARNGEAAIQRQPGIETER